MRMIDADALIDLINRAEIQYDINGDPPQENREQIFAHAWGMYKVIMEEMIYNQPTLTPPNEWVRVDERLPENDGWYLVYAPEYWGHSKIYGLDGLAYSNFKHNYKVHWGIERGTGRGYPGIVTHWMPLPKSPKEDE